MEQTNWLLFVSFVVRGKISGKMDKSSQVKEILFTNPIITNTINSLWSLLLYFFTNLGLQHICLCIYEYIYNKLNEVICGPFLNIFTEWVYSTFMIIFSNKKQAQFKGFIRKCSAWNYFIHNCVGIYFSIFPSMVILITS